MSVETALVVASSILVATLVGIIAFAAAHRRKAQEEELRRAASARGWTFNVVSERGTRIKRWTGSTDGVAWMAESLVRTTGGGKNRRYHHIARWHGAWSPGISRPIVVMGLPKGKEELGKTIADGDGFFARLAQKATGFAFDKSIDLYFGDGPGKEVDATTMQRVDVKIPGFVVMANDPHEGARIMQQGLHNAVLSATSDTSSVLSDVNRPWILLRPHAVSLARMERFRDMNELEGFIRAGVSLTRSFKFGRPEQSG